MKALIARYGELLLALLLVVLYVGSVAAWLAYEDAALEAERRYRDLERLLVIVVKAVEAGEREQRGDGGAGSRSTADRPGADRRGEPGHVWPGAGGADNGDGRKGPGHQGPRLNVAE